MQDELIQKRQGTYLPHWRKKGAIYFVTFRLADALPQNKVQEWSAERKEILSFASQMKRPLSLSEEERLEELSWKHIDEHLRKGHGSCWFTHSKIAELMASSLKYFDDDRYRLFAWSIMPNHVHVVFQPLETNTLETILHPWKSYCVHQANKILNRTGSFWQEEYYDHLIRNEGDLKRCVAYTWTNPEKAKLQGWEWKWRCSDDFLEETILQMHGFSHF